MLTARSLSVSIQVEGSDLPEYKAEYDEETQTARCWIPSEPGQEFVIFCQQAESSRFETAARIFLDGKKSSAACMFIGGTFSLSGRISGVRTSATTKRALQFAMIGTTGGFHNIFRFSKPQSS